MNGFSDEATAGGSKAASRTGSSEGGGPTRVLFVVHQVPMKANGGVRSLGLILRNLRDVQALVITNVESEWTDELREVGLAVEVLDELNLVQDLRSKRLSQAGRIARANASIFELVRKHGAEVVHCNDPHALRSAALGAKAAGAAVLLNLRAIKASSEPSLTTMWTMPFVDEVVVLSRDMADRLRQRLGPRAPIKHVYSVVELDRMRPVAAHERVRLREELGIPQDAFAVGYAAAFVRRKQQLELIERGLPELLSRVPNAHFYFLGDVDADREYGDLCQTAARALPPGRAHFVGFARQVERWFCAWDAVVVASYDEGLARSMIESLACGTPVASFDVPSAREILQDRQCGKVFDVGDFASLSRQLSEWAANPEELARLARSARATAEELFRAGDVASRYQQIWRKLANREQPEEPADLQAGRRALASRPSIGELIPILRCPRCRAGLRRVQHVLQCTREGCQFAAPHNFLYVRDCPVLVDFESSILTRETFEETGGVSLIQRSKPQRLKQQLRNLLMAPRPQTITNVKSFIEQVMGAARGSRTQDPARLSRGQDPERPTILVVGGATVGAGGTKQIYESPLRIVAFDIYASDLTQFVADAHRIPLADASVDGVLVQAVLEHVLDPWIVVEEIHRVLKPNGVVYAETPFMQPVHEGAYDFARFSESGHRWLFRKFERIDSGAALGAGTQLQWAASYAARSLARSHRIGRWAAVALFWLQYLDRLSDPAFSIDAASAVYFLGCKAEHGLQPREMVEEYRGAQRNGR